AKRVKQVIAVELDDKLAEVLQTSLSAQAVKNVEVVNENILRFKISDLRFKNYKIVANLPYNITSIFLRKFLSLDNARDRSADIKPELMVLMLQKEVAERVTAKPPKMSLLAVSVQYYAKPEIIGYVPKKNFWPEPEVDSAIIKINPHKTPLPFGHLPLVRGEIQAETSRSSEISLSKGGNKAREIIGLPLLSKEGLGGGHVDKDRDFFRLVKYGFSAKRKMLKNNLAAGLRINQNQAENKLISLGFNPKIRAQELSVEDWLRLFGEFVEFMV
ncbi:MAG: rRNA adenine dimethyltransferase family protein, partial [Candidatus Omnitrophota bacterium]